VPWQQILVYIEAIVRVYNRLGRRDNMYKARIKILVKAEGQRFVDAVNVEFAAHAGRSRRRGAPHPQAEFDRVAASFQLPAGLDARHAAAAPRPPHADAPAYTRWLQRNVHAHKLPATAR
jgi:sulfite reductase (NADPH) hemoprotein beta-component